MTDTVVSSASKEVVIGFERPFVIIGERINPTGRKVLTREALNGRKIERIVEEEQYIPERYNRRSKLRIELAPGENKQEIKLEG